MRLLSVVFFVLPVFAGDGPLTGFSEEGSRQQRALEARFDAQMNPANLREWMEFMSSKPHHVGSPHGKAVADFMVGKFRSWGFDAQLETYYVLLPTPKKRVLKLLEPVAYEAELLEPAIPEDRTSGLPGQLPIYNAYSPDGKVTGELVYVNRGLPQDYDELARHGIDVKGKIVIVRYYGSWRGIKPKVAAERGAIGCIIFTDPGDDGYAAGDEYPKGGFRNEYSAQRGSIVDMPRYSGDPLTPGIPATKDAKRLKREEAPTLPKIPTLPIGYKDALPLLKALDGPVVPAKWRGGLPIAYHMGPGPAKVHLELEFDWNIVPAHNVIAKMEGKEFPDQWVIRGNHHDAWVFGAMDPVSGMVSVMEEARAIGELAKTGWRPKRTLIYAGWDAEEQGLMGSVEWAEDHAEELKEKAVMYLNSDSNGRGMIYLGGSHTLERFANEVASEMKDPKTGDPVLKRSRAWYLINDPTKRSSLRGHSDLPLFPLGSGSDWTAFLQHLGISSLNVDYGSEGEYGQYHSSYDSFDHFIRFMDQDFSYGVLLARTNGRIMLRMANAELLPFDFGPFTETMGRYVDELVKVTDDMREQTERENRWLAEGLYRAAANPAQTYIPPEPKDAVPHINFAPLANAMERLRQATKAYQQAVRGKQLDPEKQAAINKILMKTERALTRSEGLPGRSWFTHQIYAPGFYTGYGVKTLPGVREALELRQWKLAEEQVVVLAGVFDNFSAQLKKAAELAH